MTDYDTDHEGDQSSPDDEHDIWVYLWMNNRDHPLTRFAIAASIIGIAGWLLIKALGGAP